VLRFVMPYCKECGKKLLADDKFCSYCGAPVSAMVAPQRPKARPETPSQRIEVLRERAVAARHSMWISIVILLIGILLLGVGFYLYSIGANIGGEIPLYWEAGFTLLIVGGLVALAGLASCIIDSLEQSKIMREIEKFGMG
jgi:hypothetical protein